MYFSTYCIQGCKSVECYTKHGYNKMCSVFQGFDILQQVLKQCKVHPKLFASIKSSVHRWEDDSFIFAFITAGYSTESNSRIYCSSV